MPHNEDIMQPTEVEEIKIRGKCATPAQLIALCDSHERLRCLLHEVFRTATRELARNVFDRWSEVTGGGSMWGDDAYVLEPLRDAIGEPLTASEQASIKRDRVAELEHELALAYKEIKRNHDAMIAVMPREASLKFKAGRAEEKLKVIENAICDHVAEHPPSGAMLLELIEKISGVLNG